MVLNLTRKRLKVTGADAIYATNKNRNYISKHQTNTDIKPKVGDLKTTKKSKK